MYLSKLSVLADLGLCQGVVQGVNVQTLPCPVFQLALWEVWYSACSVVFTPSKTSGFSDLRLCQDVVLEALVSSLPYTVFVPFKILKTLRPLSLRGCSAGRIGFELAL